VGPEVRITEFRVDDSWMQLRGDFLITPWLIASSNSVSSLSQASANVLDPLFLKFFFLGSLIQVEEIKERWSRRGHWPFVFL
jgi:hypothetical protein